MGTSGPQHITIIDSSTIHCIDVPGDGNFVLPGILVDDSIPISSLFTILLADGAC